MKIFLICLCVLLIIPVLLSFRHYYVKLRLQRLLRMKYDAIKMLIGKLESGNSVTKKEVLAIAQNPALRITLFRMLEAYHRPEIFPAEFYTEEKGAESYMVNWLEFPTELGHAPEEIMLLKVVTPEIPVRMHYYVFKFRTVTPKWASRMKWMLGVCGPYDHESTPFDTPLKVFSRFNPIDFMTPETEAQWVHDNITPSHRSI